MSGRRRAPSDSNPVGAFIQKMILARYGLTIVKAAEILGTSRQTLHDLLAEGRSLTPEMALRIEMAFGYPMETTLGIQLRKDITDTNVRLADLKIERYVQHSAAVDTLRQLAAEISRD